MIVVLVGPKSLFSSFSKGNIFGLSRPKDSSPSFRRRGKSLVLALAKSRSKRSVRPSHHHPRKQPHDAGSQSSRSTKGKSLVLVGPKTLYSIFPKGKIFGLSLHQVSFKTKRSAFPPRKQPKDDDSQSSRSAPPPPPLSIPDMEC